MHMHKRDGVGVDAKERYSLYCKPTTNYLGRAHLWRRRLVIALLLALPALTYSIILACPFFNIPPINYLLPWGDLITAICATIAILYFGLIYWRSTWQGFKQHLFNVDSLIAIGTTTAYLFSIVSFLVFIAKQHQFSTLGSSTSLHFSVTIYLFAFAIFGKWLEARANNKSEQSVRQLINLRPELAHLVRGSNITTIGIDRVQVGDRLLVKAGEAIPADGIVVKGKSAVNEAMLTGESLTVNKTINSKVISGSINKSNDIEIVAEQVGKDTLLGHIIETVTTAQASRSRIENTADYVANLFVPAVLIAGLTTFLICYYPLNIGLDESLLHFLAILIAACPWAFGLAAPTVIANSITIANRMGVLLKHGESLNLLHNVDSIVFDKTGTLTTGKPVITDIDVLRGNAKQALTLAFSLENNDESAAALAINQRAKRNRLILKPVKHRNQHPQGGVSGIIDGTKYFLGHNKLAEKYCLGNLPPSHKRLSSTSQELVYLFTRQNIIAVFAVSDQLKPTAKQTIKQLKRMNFDIYLLSGDNPLATQQIARHLGIKNIIPNVTPDAKANHILKLRKSGKVVAMVGDGINDAPALASANIGIAVGSGTNAAIETGDIVLATDDAMVLPKLFNLSKASVGKIYQNIFFALFYNIVSLPIATGSLTMFGLQMRPELAGFILAISSLAVILNALSLKTINYQRTISINKYLVPMLIFTLSTLLYIIFIFIG